MEILFQLWIQRLQVITWFMDVCFYGNGVGQYNFQRWVVALFENPVPDGVSFIKYAMPTIILITVINLSLTLSEVIQSFLSAHITPQISNQMSEILTTYTHKQSMSFWVGRMSGKISSQIGYIEKGINVFRDYWEIIVRILAIIINGQLLFMINRYVAYLFIFALFFRVMYAWIMRKKIKQASEESSGASSNLSGRLIDSFSNFHIVKLFAGADKEKQSLKGFREKRIKTIVNLRYVTRLFWAIPGMLWDLLFGGTIFFCIVLYQQGTLNVSDIIYAISVYQVVMHSIGFIINRFPDIIDATAAAKKAYKELVVPIEIMDKENAKKLQVKRGMLEFRNVSFKYKNKGKYVLHDLSLTVKPGERVGVVGSSGAGKTTLVNLLMRFYDPQSGGIFIDGQNIADVQQESLRENIAFIPQDPTMFNRTIGENIAYGKFGAKLPEIRRAAKFASADKFIMDTEKGYDSMVGDRGIKLSGGQKQRIAIARAFLKNAPILVLDEATSALDSETEIAIQKSFDKLSRGRTTIAIAHRLSTLRNMDRIIVVNRGRVVESGSHTQLLRKRGEYYRLWQMQSGGFLQEE